MKLYPIQFIPILKERIWGGKELYNVLNKKSDFENTGESWEISAVPGDISIVENGFLQGQSLTDIIEKYPAEILGNKVLSQFGAKFPLLFKFIDAKEDLSIQLHPNDALAKKRHNSFGKTEMWYIMQATKNARIVLGFKENSNENEYLFNLKNNTLLNLLQEIPVEKGGVFFLETGVIHAIGGGILLAEIQQTSDITYRVYDWNRKDKYGNGRELHTDLALEAINYNTIDSKIEYEETANAKNKLVATPFFTSNIIVLSDTYEWQNNLGSFTVFICTEGDCSIKTENETTSLKKGATILIPACIDKISLKGNATLLEIYL